VHNWIVEPSDSDVRLVLLASATAGVAASKLRVRADREPSAALRILERTARESTNEANREYYASFLAIEPEARAALITRIDVIGEAATAAEIEPSLARAVRKSVTARRRPALVQRRSPGLARSAAVRRGCRSGRPPARQHPLPSSRSGEALSRCPRRR
jgi:hypothetical protein